MKKMLIDLDCAITSLITDYSRSRAEAHTESFSGHRQTDLPLREGGSQRMTWTVT